MPEQPEAPVLPDIPAPKFKKQPPAPELQTRTPVFTFLQKLLPPLREKALRRTGEQAQLRLRRDQEEWEEKVAAITAENNAIWQRHERKKAEQLTSEDHVAYTQATNHWREQATLLEQEYRAAVAAWQQAKLKIEAAAETQHAQITDLRDRYLAGNREAIQQVVQSTLQKSRYPTAFPRNSEVHYTPENRIALITSQLPDFQRIAILRDGKKVAQREKTQLQEDALYSITLRTLYEVVASDEINAIESIAFNGWVDFIDGATGQPRQACILSVHATKVQIAALNIGQVNPAECFRALRGLAAKRVSVYTPVAPILTLNKEDDRLIAGRPVIDGLSADDNLAAMEWDTFEHLVRELFEKEFSRPGAEVRITRASRDRGVDAIVFDPDPLHGGKFVIQAKKYTNLVDVASVRDLFGTVQAESANRGYLVTTSHFGPDAHEFAKDKNITLIDGPNLLHLFEKHGYKFRIDIAEARKLMNLT